VLVAEISKQGAPASHRGSNIDGFNYLIKRAFDIVCGAILATLLFPVTLLAAVAILVFDGPVVLYRQIRIGAYGQPFEMLKLRTMNNRTADLVHREYVEHWICDGQGLAAKGNQPSGAEQKVFKICDDPRITRVGKLLRRFSLDELPQLWNVLRGDMSLIGPRPALPYELEHYQEWHRRRLQGMPGITGLWQINGRNRVSFDDMVRLDLKYLENWSLASDIRILMQTIPALLRGDGL
jgi:lipopolysaccharide/colanic/teichoic acid biosynthesis glycosyltransferase